MNYLSEDTKENKRRRKRKRDRKKYKMIQRKQNVKIGEKQENKSRKNEKNEKVVNLYVPEISAISTKRFSGLQSVFWGSQGDTRNSGVLRGGGLLKKEGYTVMQSDGNSWRIDSFREAITSKLMISS